MKTGVVQEVQDLTYLSWDKIRSSSGTAGSFLKAYSELEGEKIYYKLSNYDAFHGIIGHECVNEIIVDRLLSLLGIKHLHYQLAPLFDHGLSLIFNCHDEKAMHEFDVMIDRPVQCFVGSKSTKNNLQLIPADKIPKLNKLHEKDRESLFADLSLVMPEIWQDKIWEMIWKRWQYYESFCNQR